MRGGVTGGGGVKQPVARVPCVSGLLSLDPLDPPAGSFPASLRPDSGSYVLGFGWSESSENLESPEPKNILSSLKSLNL